MTAEQDYKPMAKLSSVHFDRSVPFVGGEVESASVWKPGSPGSAPSNSVDEILPALIGPTGDISLASEKTTRPTDGVVLRKRVHDLTTRQRVVRQTFVPWSNVRGVQYGE